MAFQMDKLTVKAQEAVQNAQRLAEKVITSNCCRCICSRPCWKKPTALSNR